MGVYYKKTHKIAGINFLPRLTLAEYNNLTVKPEHWIRTDSPFDYSKTDIPKLTLAQYQDLAIKPKFWIRTDAPQSYTTISATQVDVTDSVSVKDYLDNLDATQVAYDSGNVKQFLDTLNGYFPIIDGGSSFISDLDIPQSSLTDNAVYRHIYGTSTTHAPTTSSGSVYTFTNNNKLYGRQITVGDGGVYTRVLSNGTYGDWQSMNGWTLVDSIDVADTDSHTKTIPSQAKELLIEYGKKNGSQIYGGSTIVLSSMSAEQGYKVNFVPCYTNGNTTPTMVFNLMWYPVNTLIYQLVTRDSTSTSGRIRIFYK